MRSRGFTNIARTTMSEYFDKPIDAEKYEELVDKAHELVVEYVRSVQRTRDNDDEQALKRCISDIINVLAGLMAPLLFSMGASREDVTEIIVDVVERYYKEYVQHMTRKRKSNPGA